MAQEYEKLDLNERIGKGKSKARSLRRDGMVPGVYYFHGKENVNLQIDKKKLYHAMSSGQHVFEAEMNGETQYVTIKGIQYHPVTDEIIHVDLMRVRRSEKMTILVHLVLVGSSIGVKEGGILSQSISQVEVSCLPTNVPENIEINIENIEQGQSLNVGDIELKDKEVELLTASDINILTIQAPGGAEDDAEEAEETEGDEESSSELDTPDQKNENNESS